jgi:hypothetical protein
MHRRPVTNRSFAGAAGCTAMPGSATRCHYMSEFAVYTR